MKSKASRRWHCRRDLGLSYKTAFVLLHKLREAMAAELKGRVVGGEGKIAEVDSGYFGGYVKPANLADNRKDRRFAVNQSGKRKAVIIIRERDGNSLPAVFRIRRPSPEFHQVARREGHHRQRGRKPNWNESALPLRNEAHQP